MAQDFNVNVRLSASGGQQAAQEIKPVADSLRDVDGGAKQVLSTITSLAKGFGLLAMGVAGLTALSVNLAGQMLDLAGGYEGVIKRGLEYNQTLEASRIGMAAVLTANQRFIDSTGDVVKGNDALNIALGMSSVLQKQLQQDALRTAATYKELNVAFQSSAGTAFAQGIKDPDQIRKIVLGATQAMSALGLESRDASVQVNMMLTGMRGHSASLTRALGLTKDEINAVKASGQDLGEFFLKKLEPYTIAAAKAQETLAVRLSNLGDMMDFVFGQATEPLMDFIKPLVTDFTKMLSGMQGKLNALGEDLADLARKTAPLIGPLLNLLGAMADLTLRVLQSFTPLVPAFAKFIELLAGATSVLARITEALGQYVVASTAAAFAILALSLAVSGLPTVFALARTAALAFNAALLANPYVAAAAAITGLVLALGALPEKLEAAAADERAAASMDKFIERVKARTGAELSAADAGRIMRLDLEKRAQVFEMLATQARMAEGPLETVENIIKRVLSTSLTVEPVIKDTDLKTLQEWDRTILKIRGDIDALNVTGFSRKIADVQASYAETMKQLRDERVGKLPDEQAKIDVAMMEQTRLRNAKLQAINREMIESDRKRLEEIIQVEEGIAAARLTGTAKELDAVARRAQEETRESQRRIEKAKTDGASYAKVLADETRLQNAILERSAQERNAIVERTGQEWAKVQQQAIASVMAATGNELGAQISDLTRRFEEDTARLFADLMSGALTGDQFAAAAKAMAEAYRIALGQMERESDAKTAAIAGNWMEAWAKINVTIKGTVSEARSNLGKLATYAEEYGTDAAAGFVAGWARIQAQVPTVVESVRDLMTGLWSSLTRSFDDLFYNVLAGKLHSLGDVFRELWDAVLKSFSGFLAEMLQRWLKKLLEMRASGQTLGEGLSPLPQAKSYGPNGEISGGGNIGMSTGGVIGAGAVAAGLGFYAGYSGATTNRVSAGLGGAAGGVLGIAGGLAATGNYFAAAIAAVVAGLLWLASVLVKVNTEIHVRGQFGTMVRGIGSGWGPIGGGQFDPNVMGGGGRDPLSAPGGGTGGGWRPPGGGTGGGTGGVATGRAPNAFERAGGDVIRDVVASMTDIFRLAAPESARAFATSYQKFMFDILGNAVFDIAAGSQEDVTKNIELFMKSTLPKMVIQAGFGQVGYGPAGNRDLPGGLPGFDWNIGNDKWMTKDGEWIHQQLYDPEAPIPKMLAGLGVTAARVKEIATRLTTDDPQKFLAFLQSLVQVLVGFRDLGKEMAKTRDELFEDFRKESSQSPAESFKKPAAAIQDLFASLDLYSGDEQLQKAQEALEAARQFWEEMKNAARQVWALMQQLSAGIQGQRAAMRDTLATLLDPSTANARARELMDGVWGRIANATTPEEVANATREAQEAVKFLFDQLIARIQEAQALLQSTGALATDFRALGTPEAPWSVRGVNDKAFGIWNAVEAAAKLTGQAQVDAIKKVEAAARDMYQSQQQAIASIDSNVKTLSQSIAAQRGQMRFASMLKQDEQGNWVPDTQRQGASILDTIKNLMSQISGATSPEQVKFLTDQIQALVSQYFQMVPDVNKAAASEILDKILTETERMATEAYAKMRADLVNSNKLIADALEKAGILLSDNIAAAATEIGQLTHFLGDLDKAIRTKLGGMVDDILKAGEALRAEMEKQAKLFTGELQPATSGAASALAGEQGLSKAADRATASTNALADAMDRLILKIDGVQPGAGSTATAGRGATAARANASAQRVLQAAFALQRRAPGIVAPALGV